MPARAVNHGVASCPDTLKPGSSFQQQGSSSSCVPSSTLSSRRPSDSGDTLEITVENSSSGMIPLSREVEACRDSPWDSSYVYPPPEFLQQGGVLGALGEDREGTSTSLHKTKRHSVAAAMCPRDVGDLLIKNTFLDFVTPRPASWEEFFQERKVRSCPASMLCTESGVNPEVSRVATWRKTSMPRTSSPALADAATSDDSDQVGSAMEDRRPSYASTADEAEIPVVAPPARQEVTTRAPASAPSKLPPPWRRKLVQASAEPESPDRRTRPPADRTVTVSRADAATAPGTSWPRSSAEEGAANKGAAASSSSATAAAAAAAGAAATPLSADVHRIYPRGASAPTARHSAPISNIAAAGRSQSSRAEDKDAAPHRHGWQEQGMAGVASEFADGDEEDDDEGVPISMSLADFVDTSQVGTAAAPTIGSLGHHLQLCKPCAFVDKGCASGTDCRFCHLCEPGEKKRRKKEKLQLRRELNRWKRSIAGYGNQWKMASSGTW